MSVTVRRCRICHQAFDGGRKRALHMADAHQIPLPALYAPNLPDASVGPIEAMLRRR